MNRNIREIVSEKLSCNKAFAVFVFNSKYKKEKKEVFEYIKIIDYSNINDVYY